MEEDKSIVTATATNVVSTVESNGEKTPTQGEKATKKRGAFTFLKVAMFMARRGPSGKSKPPVPSKNDKLMKLVGSMRPLHLQDNQSSPPPSIDGKQSEQIISTPLSSPDRASSSSSSVDSMSQYGSATNLQALDHKGGMMRPYASTPNLQALDEVEEGSESLESRYASSTNLQKMDKRSSRYASAKDLLELELKGESDDDDDDDDDKELDNNKGDDMIDAKADEFIAKFYNQMKLQHARSF